MRLKHRCGATLVDLIIVVLITGILAAAGAPRFTATIETLRCRAVAERIAGDLNFARQTAMQTCTSTSVAFDAEGYKMQAVPHPFKPYKNYSVAFAEIDSRVSLREVDFGGSQTISFNSYGIVSVPSGNTSVQQTGSVQVSIGAAAGVVNVNFITGEASVL